MSEKSYGKQIKVPVGSIPKAHTWLPDGALASEVQNCGCKQASGAYTAVAQDAKMEILVNIRSINRDLHTREAQFAAMDVRGYEESDQEQW